MTDPVDPPADDPEPARRSSRRVLLAGTALGVVGVGAAATTLAGSDAGRALTVSARGRDIIADVGADASPEANSGALTSALHDARATGVDLVVPAGTFRHQGLTLPPDGRVTVRGAGREVTILQNAGSAASITAHGVPGSPDLDGWQLGGLTLTAERRTPDQPALSVTLGRTYSVTDLSIREHGIGVRHESGWDCGYDGVSVSRCTVGWLFPRTSFAPSAPVGLRNCSAWDCGTAVRIDDALESMTWIGGDFSGCDRGVTMTGNSTRSLSFQGINFERIRTEDVVVGDADTGPTAVSFVACRFLRTDPGGVSARFVRGDCLQFIGSGWTNYDTAISQDGGSGQLVLSSCVESQVARFVVTAGQASGSGIVNAGSGTRSLRLSVDDASMLPAVVGTEGTATKMLSGPGRRTVSDADFAIRPVQGWTCLLRDETDRSVRHAVRADDGWYVSAPYQRL